MKYLRYAAVSLLVIYFFVILYNLITHDRQWDFRAYYYAAALHDKGGNPYDFGELVESSNGYVTLPYVYPPITLYFWKLLAAFDYPVAYYLRFGLKVIIFILLLLLWRRYFITDPAYRILLYIFCLFGFKEAIQVDFYTGNVSLFEQVLIWPALWFFLKRKPIQFAVLILAASLFKFTNMALLLLLLLDRDGKSLIAIVAAPICLIGLNMITFISDPQLTEGFFRSIVGLTETGNTNQASLVLATHLANWLNRIFGMGIAYLDWIIYALYLIILLSAVYLHIRGYDFKANRLDFLMGGLFLYALVMPRFKDYSYIVLIVPSIYLIEKALAKPIYKALIIAAICVTFFRFQGLLTVFILFIIYLRYIKGKALLLSPTPELTNR